MNIEVLPPYTPLVNDQAVAFFESIVTPLSTVFEYGAGKSTIWFAGHARHVTSVENNPQWFTAVCVKLDELGLDADLHLVEFDDRLRDQKALAKIYVAVIDTFPDESLDVVFVDGKARPWCIRDARAKVRPGGWLVADDITWHPVKSALHLLDGWRETRFRGVVHGAIDGLPRTNTTGFYQKPDEARQFWIDFDVISRVASEVHV